jgi:radical SAM superfamily enzyme YgiQ (UPF0313 family)
MAPAMLKSAVESAGLSAVAFDLNAIIVNHIYNHPNKLLLQDFFYFERMNTEIIKDIVEIFDLMVQEIVKYQPKYVALSLLHYQCQAAGKWLSFCLKKHDSTIKIIMGGTGIMSQFASTDETYVQQLKNANLIDHYIRGDGEQALTELLIGNCTFDGIDSTTWKEILDLDSLPYPNYDDYDFSLYQSPYIGILGSRGCVRKCTFCDVHEHWKQFRWIDAKITNQEMLYQN